MRFFSASAVLLGAAATGRHDEFGLVQLSTNVGASATTGALVDALQSRHQPNFTRFMKHFEKKPAYKPDCENSPQLCQAPMNCEEPPVDMSKPMVEGGRPNYHSWCSLPYELAAAECAAGNYAAYGRMVHQAQVGMDGPKFVGATVEKIDAHYCFTWGHCQNTKVTQNTTLDDMVAMCDETFGRDAWAKITGNDVMAVMKPKLLGGELSLQAGLPHLSHAGQIKFAAMSCAMGNYHCDTMYCQQEYCHDPKWIDMLGQLPVELM